MIKNHVCKKLKVCAMLSEIEKNKKLKKIVGYTCSTFDILHAGHIAMLAEAKANCDYLVVGLLNDPTIDRPNKKNKPVQGIFERWVQVQAVEYVDCVIPFSTEQDIIDMLLLIKPDIRFVGEEYYGTNFTGCDIENVKIYFNKREHSFSSTELRDRVAK